MRALGCFVALCLSATAFADGVSDRVAKGEDLAKQGKWTEAIENFKAADKIDKRAKHACLIALAYIRRELWPQAEVFLTLCHERANPSDPVPDWVPLAEQQLKERLVKAKVASVQIRVVPEAIAGQAQIAVSAFEPDELFAPRTIHLGMGKHLITVTAPGQEPRQQAIEITGEGAREVVIDFEAKAPPPIPVAPRPKEASRSKVPLIVMAAGGVIVFGGAGYHLFAFKPARDDLVEAKDGPTYDDRVGKFNSARTTTIALYAIGGAAIVTGLVLNQTVFKKEGPRVSAGVSRDGGMLVMEWTR